MKNQYVNIMEKALHAYSDDDISSYFSRVKEEGITEHGFPRLVANIGILIAKGRRTDLFELFVEMMDFTTEAVTHISGRGGNDFSVRELVSAILALEEEGTVPEERTRLWRSNLSRLVPLENYREIATPDRSYVGNWAAYNAASEFLRVKAGIALDTGFVDSQLDSQLRNFDENGMYMDPGCPMLYDLATRAQFALMLRLGYSGRHKEAMREMLEKSRDLTEKMQSVTGSIAFGGRSNQMLFNEMYMAAMFEYYAFSAKDDPARAGELRAAAKLSLDSALRNVEKVPLTHVKNSYPRDERFGCEEYAYFDKYMITLASFAYVAYLLADNEIAPTVALATKGGYVAKTSDKFHKVFVNNGGYFLEFDTAADAHYDAVGLGRIHKTGAPEPLVLSVPFAEEPNYKIGEKNDTPLALTSKIGKDVTYSLLEVGNVNSAIYFCMSAEENAVTVATEKYSVDEDGINVIVDTNSETEYNIPAFMFDGQIYTNTTLVGSTLRVFYRGFIAEYSSPDAKIIDTGRTFRNRNGIYRLYKASAVGRVSLHIKIYEGSPRDV